MKTVERKGRVSAGRAVRGARVPPWYRPSTVLGKEGDCLDVCLGGGTGQQEKTAHFGDTTRPLRAIANIEGPSAA